MADMVNITLMDTHLLTQEQLKETLIEAVDHFVAGLETYDHMEFNVAELPQAITYLRTDGPE